ncbi:Protein CBG27009 [Caenorhabditis briggsae]|uniref:Protein CBG27009 n=1 Tax=Caenorhabditis briggsae TaxID=6238 RepID=B6IH65_CAEBR|nr:Protein CBG27009 [Caenorhabditis briggsae]CAR99245.1 Protein CBG27009 [Caenorhabditis briggsae]
MVVLTVGYWIFTVIGIITTIYTATLCGIIIKKYIL